MFCCLELVSCRLAVATDYRLELQPVVTYIPKCDIEIEGNVGGLLEGPKDLFAPSPSQIIGGPGSPSSYAYFKACRPPNFSGT